MENWNKIIKQLKKPFPAKKIKWRVAKVSGNNGLALAYIDSRAVMNRLDDVVGSKNWQRKHSFGRNGEVLCSIGIYDEEREEWVWKTDGAAQTNFEAEKGGLSDSFKRAAVSWGIGRYLYSLSTNWVPLDNNDRIKKRPKLPAWALPKNSRPPKSKQKRQQAQKKADKQKPKSKSEKQLKMDLWLKLRDKLGYDKMEVKLIILEKFETLELSEQKMRRFYKNADRINTKNLLKKALNHREELLEKE